MRIKQILKFLYYKPLSHYIKCLPYRSYIFEIKFKNNKETISYETNYILSLSFNSFLEDLYIKEHIKIEDKHYSTKEIEYTKLIKTIPYYAYVWDACNDCFKCIQYNNLQNLIIRQKEYIKYAKYLKPKRLKNIINDSKNYYV